jgi:REP element-mobilizing transposase RayT
MSHTYIQNVVHIIFSTKNRAPTITASLRPRLWNYIVGICRNQKIFCHAIGGTADHLHLLIQIPADSSLAKSVNAIKSLKTARNLRGKKITPPSASAIRSCPRSSATSAPKKHITAAWISQPNCSPS